MTEKVNNTFDILDIMFDVSEMNYSNKAKELERIRTDGDVSATRYIASINAAEVQAGNALVGLISVIDADIAARNAQRERYMALGAIRLNNKESAIKSMTTSASQYQVALRRSTAFLVNLHSIKDSVDQEGFRARVGVLNQSLAKCSNLCGEVVQQANEKLVETVKSNIESACATIDKIELPRYRMSPIELAYYEAVEAGKNGDASVLKRTYDRFGDVQIGVETPVGIVNGNVLDMIVMAWSTEMATSNVSEDRESNYVNMINLIGSSGMVHSEDFSVRCEPLVATAKILQPQ